MTTTRTMIHHGYVNGFSINEFPHADGSVLFVGERMQCGQYSASYDRLEADTLAAIRAKATANHGERVFECAAKAIQPQGER